MSPGSVRENWTHPTRAITCVTCFRCLRPGSGLRLQLGVRSGTPSIPESSSCLQGGGQVALRGTVPTSGPIPFPEKATRTRICLLHPQNPSLIQVLVAEMSPAPWASPPPPPHQDFLTTPQTHPPQVRSARPSGLFFELFSPAVRIRSGARFGPACVISKPPRAFFLTPRACPEGEECAGGKERLAQASGAQVRQPPPIPALVFSCKVLA